MNNILSLNYRLSIDEPKISACHLLLSLVLTKMCEL